MNFCMPDTTYPCTGLNTAQPPVSSDNSPGVPYHLPLIFHGLLIIIYSESCKLPFLPRQCCKKCSFSTTGVELEILFRIEDENSGILEELTFRRIEISCSPDTFLVRILRFTLFTGSHIQRREIGSKYRTIGEEILKTIK